MQIRATKIYNLKMCHSRCASITRDNDVVCQGTTSFRSTIHYFRVHNATRYVLRDTKI